MTTFKYPIDEEMRSANVLITNAMAPDILPLIGEHGFTGEKLNEGMQMYIETSGLVSLRDQLEGEYSRLGKKLKKRAVKFLRKYKAHYTLARRAFQDDEIRLRDLALIEKRKRTRSGWMQQAKIFYENILEYPDVMDVVQQLNMNTDNINSRLTLLKEIEDEDIHYQEIKGKVQEVTRNRDMKIDELHKWVMQLKIACRDVFQKNPQVLERLGILVKNRRETPKPKPPEPQPDPNPDPTPNPGPTPTPAATSKLEPGAVEEKETGTKS